MASRLRAPRRLGGWAPARRRGDAPRHLVSWPQALLAVGSAVVPQPRRGPSGARWLARRSTGRRRSCWTTRALPRAAHRGVHCGRARRRTASRPSAAAARPRGSSCSAPWERCWSGRPRRARPSRRARRDRRRGRRPARLRHVRRPAGAAPRRRGARGARRRRRAARSRRAAARRRLRRARAYDADGAPLLVKVYGRDAYDTQLLEKVWRTLWYQDDGPRAPAEPDRGRRARGVRDAARAAGGVPTREVVVTAGVGRRAMRSSSSAARAAAPALHRGRARRRAARRGLAGASRARRRRDRPPPDRPRHGRARRRRLIGLVDFAGATVAAPAGSAPDRPGPAARDHRGRSRAPIARSRAAVDVARHRRRRRAPPVPAVGGASAAAAAGAQGGRDRHRRSPCRGGRAVGVEAARARAAAPGHLVDGDPDRPARARRLDAHRRAAGLDCEAAARARSATRSWGWLALGFVVAQLPRLTQAVSTLGSIPARLPFVPVYVMQLTTGYLNLALPSSIARMTRQHPLLPAPGASRRRPRSRPGAIDSFVSTVVQALLLALLLLFSEASLDFELSTPSGSPTPALRRRRSVLALAARRRVLVGAGSAGDRRARPRLVAGGARVARRPARAHKLGAAVRRQRRDGDPVRDRARRVRQRVRVRHLARRPARDQHQRLAARELRPGARRRSASSSSGSPSG